MKRGILSDAHGHVEAFQLALNILRRQGAECFHFLGDAISYFPGSAVVESLMIEKGIQAIAGNHELMLLSGGAPTEKDKIYQMRRTASEMSIEQIQFLRGLPRRSNIKVPCGDVLFVHGSPSDESYGYVYPVDDLSKFGVAPDTTVFMGHTHRPFIRRVGGALYVNVGSCGMPRDCGHLGAACLFDDCSGEVRILRFDIRAVTEAALRRCHSVHPSVRELFARKLSGPLVGTLIDV